MSDQLDIIAPPSLRQSRYWRQVLRESTQAKWVKLSPAGALLCLPVIAGWIAFSTLRTGDRWSVLAIAGAVSTAFGAFQKLGRNQLPPMFLLIAGIAASVWIGNVAGYVGWLGWVITAGFFGYLFGAFTQLGYGAWWMGMQWMIALLVYGSRAWAPWQAAENALAVACGGLSQLLFLLSIRPFTRRWFQPQDQPVWNDMESPVKTLPSHLNALKPDGRYAARVGAAMLVSTVTAHLSGFQNGYWMPMTAVILLKPSFHEATLRGVSRVIGTVTGAGAVTLLLALTKPRPALLGLMLLLAIWCCLALMRVNYAMFVACVTAYVVLLLSTQGLPDPVVALHRVEATFAGAAIALLVSLPGAGIGADANATAVTGPAEKAWNR